MAPKPLTVYEFNQVAQSLVEYADTPALDGSVAYGGTLVVEPGKPDTNSLTNAAFASAPRTLYNNHMLYNAHIYYIGRDISVYPASPAPATISSRVAKPATATS